MTRTFLMFGAAALLVASPRSASAAQELLFVANSDGSPVTAYDALSSGPVSPALLIENPNLLNTYWGPWGVAFDAQQDLYIQSFLSDATSFVFPPGVDSSAPPTRVFRGGGPDSRGIAVDANGYEYVATGEGPSQILVLPPGAAGVSGNLYSVSPLRTIDTDETVWHPWPSILAADLGNHVIAAIVRAQGNALEVFDGGAAGSAAPVRVISGPLTGLGACADTACNMMAITFSPATGHLWAGVSAGSQTHVSLFAGESTGNVAPLRSIEGPSTQLAGKVITGIAESQLTGELLVLAKDSQFGVGQVLVYQSSADGNAAPVRTFTDGSSLFASAAGIGIMSENIGVGIPSVPRGAGVRFAVAPNPTRGPVTARLTLPRPVRGLHLQVFDPAGRAVATIWIGDAPAGTIEAKWEGAKAAGVYLLRASGEGLTVQERFVWIH